MNDSTPRRSRRIRTNETLPEVVCLSLCSLRTRPFPINLIFNRGHRDESSDHTTPSTGLDWNGMRLSLDLNRRREQALTPCGHGPIVNVAGGGDFCPTVVLGQ